MRELDLNELVSINGGSQETYNAGHEAGKEVRTMVDNAALLWMILTIVTKIPVA